MRNSSFCSFFPCMKQSVLDREYGGQSQGYDSGFEV